ncbi:prepilin-type N-terminal cleavage/methylation domain-containing protein [bacterium]|nr:prepilin-type N-terminal cleavage/methylation domain-containing protein [bacterium]
MKTFHLTKKKREGFTLIEVLVGIFLVGAALIGLAQMFTYGVLNNYRADNLTNATFLAQQQIDNIRNLTGDEISALSSPLDETLDTNKDGTPDFRRITQIEFTSNVWNIRVMVFPASQLGEDLNSLTSNPIQNEVRADVSTTIGR